MFRYNPKANYQPNGGKYLQILSGKDLYKQTIVVSAMENDTFPVRFPNIFVGDKLWTNWIKAPLKLWQTQLNYAVFCASSACGVSSEHLNYTKHPMIRSVYHFLHYSLCPYESIIILCTGGTQKISCDFTPALHVVTDF